MGIDAVHWKAVDIAVESFKQVKPKSAESTGDGALQSPPAQDDTRDDWLLRICDYEFITGLKTPESSMLPDKLRYENLMRRNAFLPLGIAYDEECQADAVYVLIGDSKPQRPKQPYLASSVFNCICNILGRHISRRKLHMILLFAGPQVVDRAIGHFYFRIDIGGDAPAPPSDAGRLSIHLDPSDPRHIKWVKELLLQAVNRDTSDVHFEPGEEEGRVRLRIDGDLHMVDPIPRQLFENVTNYLKIAARMNVANRRSPQDSRIQMVYPLGRKDKFGREMEREIDVRVSTLPTFCGEKMVMRLLDPRKNAELAANGLGHVIESKHLCKRFESVLGFRDGIVLVTGPTGCGKSTTLNAALFHLLSIHKDRSNIVTIEDPVEYRVPGVNQIAVDESAGLTFGEAGTVCRSSGSSGAGSVFPANSTLFCFCRLASSSRICVRTLAASASASAMIFFIVDSASSDWWAAVSRAALARACASALTNSARASFSMRSARLRSLEISASSDFFHESSSDIV